MTMAELSKHPTWAAAWTWMVQQRLERKACFSTCWALRPATITEAKALMAAVVQPTPTNSGRGALGLSLSAIGLQRGPLSGGVKNATLRYDLPSPAVAVRNLVSPDLASSAGKSSAAQPRP